MSEVTFTPPESEVVPYVPQVLLWRILVEPYEVPRETASGIQLPSETIDHSRTLATMGKLVGVGDLAFQSAKHAGETNWPKLGDWVLFGTHAGQKIKTRDGRTLIIMNDDNLLGTVEDPGAYESYV